MTPFEQYDFGKSRWAETYVGIAHVKDHSTLQAADCWGLIRVVFGRELGQTLPAYNGVDVDDAERDEIRRIVSGEVEQGCWSTVEINDIQTFDVLVFRRGRHERHVALAVDPRLMLHSDASSHSRIERFDTPEWRSRLTCVLRHASQADAA